MTSTVQNLRMNESDAPEKAAPPGPGTLARAVALHLAGKREEALEQLQRAAAGGQASAEIYRAMGHIEFELGRFEASAKSYRALLRIKPQFAMGWLNLAVCLERSSAWDQAAEAFHKASTLDASNLEARLGLALCYLRLDDPRARCGDSNAAWNWRPIMRTGFSARRRPCSPWASSTKPPSSTT